MEEEPINDVIEEKPEVVAPKEEPSELISNANAAADRIEKANENLAKLLSKQERILVENTLGGTASAGVKTHQSKEDKEINEAKKMLEGTGYEDLLDKPKD